MPLVQQRRLTRGDKPFGGILADSLQQSVAHATVRTFLSNDQGLVDEPTEQVQHVLVFDALAQARPYRRYRADRLRGFQAPPASEHREPVQQATLLLAQQVIAPVQCGTQRLLARQRCPTAAGQQAEALVEPSRELIDTQRGHPRSRQLQRKGNSIQPRTHLGNGGRVVFARRELRLNGQRPLGEQPDCRVAVELGDGQ